MYTEHFPNFEKQQEILQQIIESLNKTTNRNYSHIFRSISNSIDFITDGSVKMIDGISTEINSKISIKLEPVFLYENGALVGINFDIILIANVMDFTLESSNSDQVHRYLGRYRGKFQDNKEKHWFAKIKKMHTIVNRSQNQLFFEFIPSRRLSALVGKGPISKYQILDRVSEYIYKKQLKREDGSILLDRKLCKWFYAGRKIVTQDEMIDFLSQNSLLTQVQMNTYLKTEGSFYERHLLPRKFMADFEASSGSSKYLFGPIA